MVTINLRRLADGEPRVSDEELYIRKARELANEGQDVTLTGLAPVWLYLIVTHALEGRVRTLWCDAPDVTGAVLIYSGERNSVWPDAPGR